MLTDFTGVAQLGVISGIGMFASLLSTLTVLPALISLGAEPVVSVPRTPAWLGQLDLFPVRHAKTIRITAAAVGLAALAVAPRIRFDYNLVNLHDPSTESVSTFDALLVKGEYSKITVTGPEDMIGVLKARLEGRADAVAFLVSEHATDISVSADDTILETRIGSWLEAIGEGSR